MYHRRPNREGHVGADIGSHLRGRALHQHREDITLGQRKRGKPEQEEILRSARQIAQALNHCIDIAKFPESLGAPISPHRFTSLGDYTRAFVAPAFQHVEDGVFGLQHEELVLIFLAAAAYVQARIVARCEEDDAAASSLIQAASLLGAYLGVAEVEAHLAGKEG